SARARAVREEGRTPREGAGSLSGPPANSTAATTIPRASRTPTRFIPVLYRRFRAGIQREPDGHLPASNFLSSVTIVKSSPAARMVISDLTSPTFFTYDSVPSAP